MSFGGSSQGQTEDAGDSGSEALCSSQWPRVTPSFLGQEPAGLDPHSSQEDDPVFLPTGMFQGLARSSVLLPPGSLPMVATVSFHLRPHGCARVLPEAAVPARLLLGPSNPCLSLRVLCAGCASGHLL